ncbi:hypothetical protein G4O51_09155 [Candidatus Bathyarchaeota archaeon A05DMB-2]|jgi:hypothetical protein|nr:hypothetical protein [Candidatus Bathyarchaeota archaeon A05DMB-2]
MMSQEPIGLGLSLNETSKLRSASLSDIVSILELFKAECRARGWHISRNEDWVKADNEYHNFICARPPINTYSFRKIAEKAKCIVIERGAYTIVDAAYTAWLLSEPPTQTQEELAKVITENQALSEKTALYCLSNMAKGGIVCLILNRTQSRVFKFFENFLKSKINKVFSRDINKAQVTVSA